MSTDFSCVDDEKRVYWHLGQRMSGFSFGYGQNDFAGQADAAELICEHINHGKSLRVVLTDDIPDDYDEIKIGSGRMIKYVVALEVGGTMEMPHFEHSMAQCIEAETPKEAVEIYNKKNKCSYYYGVVIGYYLNGKIKPTEEFMRATFSRMGIKELKK